MRKFKEWHTNIIRNYMRQLNIDIFGLAWLSWSKGVIMTVILMLLTSCATFQLTTLNHDPMYPDEMKVDVIDNEFQLARKLRTDDRFRWDFAQFAMRQDMRWNTDFYFNNRMYRSAFASPFDFYWNSNQYWYNWASNSHFNMGFNHWDTFGFYGNSWNNGYGYGYYGNYWNNGYYNGWYGNGWNNGDNWNRGYRNGNNVAYHSGRRGSSNVIVGKRTNVIENRIIVNRNKPRIVNNTDVVIDKEVIKLKRNNPNIRVIRNTNNNSNSIRNYNRIENNSNNNINRNNNNSRPVRTYSPPTRTYTPPTRSSSPPVINNSSSNGRSKGSIKN
jgi:hypothetical protein